MDFFIGDIKTTRRSTPPHEAWLLCDGQLVSRSTYRELFDTLKIEQMGNTVAGSAVVTVSDTSALSVGMNVSGDHIAASTTIISIDDTTTFSMSQVAVGTGVSELLLNLQLSADTVDSSATVTLTDTSSLAAGFMISGVGIQSGTTIVSVDSATTITISLTATATGTATLDFSTTQSGITSGATIALSSTVSLQAGMHVEGIGIPVGTVIDSIVSSTVVSISGALSFSGQVPVSFLEVSSGFGDGISTFNVPNYQGRALIALGQGPLFSRGMAFVGGNDVTNSLPASTTNDGTTILGPNQVISSSPTGGAPSARIWNDISSADTTIAGSSPEGNLPPYVALNFMIKAK